MGDSYFSKVGVPYRPAEFDFLLDEHASVNVLLKCCGCSGLVDVILGEDVAKVLFYPYSYICLDCGRGEDRISLYGTAAES